ncbi:MAG TPA: phosphoribosylanthranilate isomerase [Caulobacteraceae bacterium]|jgi:phosphoribosylanthranilate isomerase|nr:phosphoribosylanthranilate isomerase [Caulobacteraceae bacterium]
MAEAKICGLTAPDAVQAALDGGAAYLGFVFFAKSPRSLSPEVAGHLAAPARGKAKCVAVTVDPDDETLDRIMARLAPDVVQLHGREGPARVAEVRARTGAEVIKAVSIGAAEDLAGLRDYEDVADYLMLDAKAPPGAILPGGNGEAFDWTLAAQRRFTRPWFLAGGLDRWNVTEALHLSGAPLVDVSSGVERGPGYKDPRLIMAFLDAVRRA